MTIHVVSSKDKLSSLVTFSERLSRSGHFDADAQDKSAASHLKQQSLGRSVSDTHSARAKTLLTSGGGMEKNDTQACIAPANSFKTRSGHSACDTRATTAASHLKQQSLGPLCHDAQYGIAKTLLTSGGGPRCCDAHGGSAPANSFKMRSGHADCGTPWYDAASLLKSMDRGQRNRDIQFFAAPIHFKTQMRSGHTCCDTQRGSAASLLKQQSHGHGYSDTHIHLSGALLTSGGGPARPGIRARHAPANSFKTRSDHSVCDTLDHYAASLLKQQSLGQKKSNIRVVSAKALLTSNGGQRSNVFHSVDASKTRSGHLSNDAQKVIIASRLKQQSLGQVSCDTHGLFAKTLLTFGGGQHPNDAQVRFAPANSFKTRSGP